MQLKQYEVHQVIDFMRRACGNDFSEKGTLIHSKISMLCSKLGYRHFYELWDAIQATTIESARIRQLLIDELTTSYSYFYREDAHFDRLADLLVKGELPVGSSTVRVWSAGCASGEETYNIAMVLEDARSSGVLAEKYHIVGSDISSKAIDIARTAKYDAADVARMPPHWRNLYCMHSGQDFEIKGQLRKNVEFRCENALAPHSDPPFDVVMCRNMIIYFDEKSIQEFCSLLKRRVKPKGYLFLGHAEILSELPGFTYVEPSLWQRDEDGNGELPLLFM